MLQMHEISRHHVVVDKHKYYCMFMYQFLLSYSVVFKCRSKHGWDDISP